MAHRCGFTERSLRGTLKAGGFRRVASLARPRYLDLWAVASKAALPDDELRALATRHLPAHAAADLRIEDDGPRPRAGR